MKPLSSKNVCPCGSGSVYQACCEVAHKNRGEAKTPEQLMRSRYSAFALNLIDYLVDTHLPSDDGENVDRRASLRGATALDWVALDVISSEVVHQDEGFVEFKAFYSNGANRTLGCLHEKSRFVRVEEDGGSYWYYVDGVFPSNGESYGES